MKIRRSVVPVTLGTAVLTGLAVTPASAATDPAPDATISSPAVNDNTYARKPLTFGGTATDDKGVASVGVAFQDRVSKLWYRPDGTFGAYYRFTAALNRPGGKSTSWRYAWTPPVGGKFLIQAVAKDTIGQPDASLPFRRFNVDATPPDTTITAPATVDNTVQRGGTGITISGAATDDYGVKYVLVSVQNQATGRYLRPSGRWGSYYAQQVPVNVPGATNATWTYLFNPSELGKFVVQVGAVDLVGLSDPIQPVRRFTVQH